MKLMETINVQVGWVSVKKDKLIHILILILVLILILILILRIYITPLSI